MSIALLVAACRPSIPDAQIKRCGAYCCLTDRPALEHCLRKCWDSLRGLKVNSLWARGELDFLSAPIFLKMFHVEHLYFLINLGNLYTLVYTNTQI